MIRICYENLLINVYIIKGSLDSFFLIERGLFDPNSSRNDPKITTKNKKNDFDVTRVKEGHEVTKRSLLLT